MADLAGIISGTDPMAPLELKAYQQQQLLNSVRDASQWANQGPFGALARTIGGMQTGGAQDTLNQIVQQRQAANPQLFQALASGNPYQWGAQNPQANPTALASILANAPDAAKAQFEGAQTQALLNQAKSYPGVVKALTQPGTPTVSNPTQQPSTAPTAAPAPKPTAALPEPSAETVQQSIAGYMAMPNDAARANYLLTLKKYSPAAYVAMKRAGQVAQ